MIIKRIGLFLMIVTCAWTIDQTCTPSTVCPDESYCNTNQAYCVCNSGYIGNCNISAPLLSNTASNFTIQASQQLLFSINPQKLNVFIQFYIQICTDVQLLSIAVMLWVQTGSITNYTQTNGITTSSSFTVGSSQCLTLLSPFLKLSQQPNGQNELLILGITDTSSTGSADIQISISQKIIEGIIIEYYLIIGISTLIGVLIVLTVIFVICKRRRRNLRRQNEMQKKESEYNDIEFFKDYMPLSNGMMLGNERPVCPICLQQIEPVEVIRKTPCQHVFHSNCIDSWCLKTLNCPVCREDLSLQAFSQKTMRRNSQLSQKIKENTFQVNWQQQSKEESLSNKTHIQHIEHVQLSLDNKYQIRQSML